MLIKSDTIGPNSSSAVPAATACGNCGAEERRLLHHVRHRGVFRRLCTSCVLRLHPQSFCPTCFQVYPPPPASDAVFTCFKCYSSSHAHCVESGGPAPPPTSYVCPLCVQPNAPIFKLRPAKEANAGIGDNCRVMDRDSAKKLLAAARIASASMNKAAVAARAEAERRAKEAAFTRKRAKEALEYVAHLVMKEKLRKKEAVLAGSSGVSATGIGGAKFDRENSNVNVSASYRNGNATGVLGPPSMVVDRVDNSNRVLAALNAVGLKENEKMRGGITAHGVVGSRVPLVADRAAMDVDGDHVNFGGEENVDTHEEILEDVDDDEAVLVQTLEEQLQHEENSLDGEHRANGPQL